MLRKSQEGVSFITVMLLAPLVALLVLVVIKLIPVYMEYESVVSSVNSMVGDKAATYTSKNDVVGTLLKRFDVNDVKNVNLDNIDVQPEGNAFSISIDYEVRTHLFYNIDLLISFSKKGEVQAS